MGGWLAVQACAHIVQAGGGRAPRSLPTRRPPAHPAPPRRPRVQRAKDERRPVPWVLLENVEALLDRHGGDPPVMQVRARAGHA